MKEANATGRFLGEADSRGKVKIQLEDVHGTWGGRRIRVASEKGRPLQFHLPLKCSEDVLSGLDRPNAPD